jgi:hypothetical protein
LQASASKGTVSILHEDLETVPDNEDIAIQKGRIPFPQERIEK